MVSQSTLHAALAPFVAAPLLFLSSTVAAQTPAEAAKVDKAKPQEAAAAPSKPVDAFAQEAQATAGMLFNDGNVSALSGRVSGYDNGAIARRNAYANHDVAMAFQLGYKFF